MLELLMHCHHVVAVEDARLGWPEVTLPVVPGMEACHWPYRRTTREHWPKLVAMQLGGAPVRATEAVGWLIDFAGPIEPALKHAWALASGAAGAASRRPLQAGKLDGVAAEVSGLAPADSPLTETARAAIAECIRRSCGVTLAEALPLQARIAAEFLHSKACREGRVGAEYARTMAV
jgi:enoyl-CoA hydratase/carnithine racemase